MIHEALERKKCREEAIVGPIRWFCGSKHGPVVFITMESPVIQDLQHKFYTLTAVIFASIHLLIHFMQFRL